MTKLNADKRTYPINKCYCEECDKARGINQVTSYTNTHASKLHTRTQKSEYVQAELQWCVYGDGGYHPNLWIGRIDEWESESAFGATQYGDDYHTEKQAEVGLSEQHKIYYG